MSVDLPSVCSIKGCGGRAMWYPTIQVWEKGRRKRSHQPIEVEIGVGFCRDHREAFKIEDFAEVEKGLIEATRSWHLAPPDFANAEVVMMPLITG